ncbi:hypothetical protein QUF72_10135, partial [Desulfobacterales bacterium HSG2]|nr:hypothetical protein [Desulfobacterales bacterium HSG2]
IYPSALRRFGIFILWNTFLSIFLVIFIEILAELIIPEGNLSKSIDKATDIALSILFIVLGFSAAEGRLLGARRKKNIQEEVQSSETS